MNPRALTVADLAGAAEDGVVCLRPDCACPPASGEFTWDDQGPQQLIAIRRFRCRAGHSWATETDCG